MRSTTDEARLRRMVRDNLPFVWRYLRRLGVPEADADDRAQEVFLVAAGRLDQIPAAKERAFLYATAIRVAANARRSRQRRQNAYDRYSEAPREPVTTPEVLSDQHKARAVLDDVLESLPDDLRETFVLFEIEELSIAEIADTLGIPMGTVGSRLRRARQKFEESVRRYQARASFRAGVAR